MESHHQFQEQKTALNTKRDEKISNTKIIVGSAFRFIMRKLDYSEQEIAEAAREICVLSISNLAPLETPRLFTTLSVTGFNDAQASKYIEHFPEMIAKYYRQDDTLSQNFVSTTQNVVMVDVPERMTERSTGRIIIDPKRHYTPNYNCIRMQDASQAKINNAGPMFIQEQLELMLSRDTTFAFGRKQHDSRVTTTRIP